MFKCDTHHTNWPESCPLGATKSMQVHWDWKGTQKGPQGLGQRKCRNMAALGKPNEYDKPT